MTSGGTSERLTVLVVDDDPRIVRLVHRIFESEGYEVLYALDGESGVAMVRSERPDVVLLDLDMPGLDGMRACMRIRETSDLPIIMLTERTAEASQVAGLDLGADDYVTKPFSPGELAARVRAVLRRARAKEASAPPDYDDGTLLIDLGRRTVALDGEPVLLSPVEFRLLEVLARSPGRVFLHEELLDAVWGADFRASSNQLKTYVGYVRRKIEPRPATPRYLLNQRGVGYFLRAQPHPAEPGGAAQDSRP